MISRNHKPTESLIRYTLGILLAVLALNAFGGGWYGMAGAPGVPESWLEGSPFTNYFIPGLILFVLVGGSALFAAIAVLGRRRAARRAAILCGVVTLIWIAVQVVIIGYVSWLQPAVAIAAILIIFLAGLLRAPAQ